MILDEIVAHKRTEIEARKRSVPLQDLEERIARGPRVKNFREQMRAEGISLIAEIKRRSPSKGEMLPDVDAVELAALYEQAGARAISILTDAKYFGGSLEDLTKVALHTKLPCLRKEFILDPYQVYESRAAGADAILLIVRILSDDQLRMLLKQTQALGMAAVVETHTEEEIRRALQAGAHIIGINNRDLDTLEVDVETTLRLKRFVPGGNTLISESGIRSRKEVKSLEAGGVDAILVGESLLSSKDIRSKIEELLCHD